MNQSHGDGNQNILETTFPWNLGAPGDLPRGPIPNFLNDYCLVAPYKSNKKEVLRKANSDVQNQQASCHHMVPIS